MLPFMISLKILRMPLRVLDNTIGIRKVGEEGGRWKREREEEGMIKEKKGEGKKGERERREGWCYRTLPCTINPLRMFYFFFKTY
jgi:hypothetical protein